METTTTQQRPRRERPKAMKLSDAAAARIRDILAKSEGQYQGVRVGGFMQSAMQAAAPGT